MLNLPNAITLTRIALVVVFTAAVSVADRYSWGYLAALVTFPGSEAAWTGASPVPVISASTRARRSAGGTSARENNTGRGCEALQKLFAMEVAAGVRQAKVEESGNAGHRQQRRNGHQVTGARRRTA